MPYDHVFQPIVINGVGMRNRICRSAHATGLGRSGIGEDLVAFHLERARGGIALSTIETAGVHPSASGRIDNWDDSIIPGYRRLTDACHAEGMRLFQQLQHAGAHGTPPDGSPPWSPSGIAGPKAAVAPLVMSTGMIADIVAAFAAAARRCREGGVDGVEVHAGHGYLLAQFLSPATNHREDGYGGSAGNRLRFLREVLAAIRAEAGDDYPLGIRISSDEVVEHGLRPEDSAAIVRDLDAGGLLDFVNISYAGYLAFGVMAGGMHTPHGYQVPASRPVRQATGLPAMVTGRVMTLAEAEAILANGDADMVSMVRATIADPALVVHARDGREQATRPCIGCNQGCIGGIFSAAVRVGCVVNPAAGREAQVQRPESRPASRPRRVLVAGAGPAGLEAARTAALRGHHVTVCEAAAAPGGQVRFARRAPTRSETALITDWLLDELGRLEVEVRLNTPVDGPLLDALQPDAVIVATGSVPRKGGFSTARPGTRVPGAGLPHVRTSWDVLGGDVPAARSAVVYDDLGHYEAIGVAEFLRQQGTGVAFVTRHGSMGHLLEGAMMVDAAHERLLGPGFSLHTRMRVAEVRHAGVVLESLDTGSQETVPADLVVFVSGNDAHDPVSAAARARGIEVRAAGDALSARYLQAAIHEGRAAGMAV